MNQKTITLSRYNDRKSCFIMGEQPDEAFLHMSWLLDDNSVIVFENTQGDDPPEALMIHDSIEDYFDSIKHLEWLRNEEWIVVNGAEEYGFPHVKRNMDN